MGLRECAFWSVTRAARAAARDRSSSPTRRTRLWISAFACHSGARSESGSQTPVARTSAACALAPHFGASSAASVAADDQLILMSVSGPASRRERLRRARTPLFSPPPACSSLAVAVRHVRNEPQRRTPASCGRNRRSNRRARDPHFTRPAPFSHDRAPSSCPLSGKVDGLLTMSPASHAFSAWLARQNPVWWARRPLHIALHNGGSVATAQDGFVRASHRSLRSQDHDRHLDSRAPPRLFPLP